jgi:hypothetical protein
MREEVGRLSAYCLAHGNCYGVLRDQVRASARKLLPPGAAATANRRGTASIAVTYPSATGAKPAVQRLVSSFESNDDVISALEASIYIPYYAGPRLTTTWVDYWPHCFFLTGRRLCLGRQCTSKSCTHPTNQPTNHRIESKPGSAASRHTTAPSPAPARASSPAPAPPT